MLDKQKIDRQTNRGLGRLADRDAEKQIVEKYCSGRETDIQEKIHTHSMIDLLIDRKADSLISKNIHRKTALIQIDWKNRLKD